MGGGSGITLSRVAENESNSPVIGKERGGGSGITVKAALDNAILSHTLRPC